MNNMINGGVPDGPIDVSRYAPRKQSIGETVVLLVKVLLIGGTVFGTLVAIERWLLSR